MKRSKTQFLAEAAMIAALYVVITVLLAPFGFKEVQVRVSEALTILPIFTPAAIPGLFIGCLIGNILGGGIVLDIAVGSIATLIGAFGTYALRKYKFVAPLAPIISNTLLVPLVLKYGYGLPFSIPLMMLTVGIGEVISCGILGLLLARAIEGTKIFSSQDVNLEKKA